MRWEKPMITSDASNWMNYMFQNKHLIILLSKLNKLWNWSTILSCIDLIIHVINVKQCLTNSPDQKQRFWSVSELHGKNSSTPVVQTRWVLLLFNKWHVEKLIHLICWQRVRKKVCFPSLKHLSLSLASCQVPHRLFE